MPAVERRKGRRERDRPSQDLYVEIQHPYGPLRSSVYRIVEKDDHGLSFLIPREEGYFLPGTPLRFSVIEQDTLKTKHLGIARHYTPVYTDQGEKFYRIGVEFRSSLNRPPRVKYVLRPARVSSGRGRRFTIEFLAGAESYAFALEDFSKYSAAFLCAPEELLGLPVGSVLTKVRIRAGKGSVFEGEAAVSRVSADRLGRVRVVVEPRRVPINVHHLRRMEVVDSAFEGTKNLIRRHESFLGLDSTFKAMVADLRFFLEDFRDYLGSPMFNVERREPEDLLGKIFPCFYEKVDSKVTRLDVFARGLEFEPKEERLYKQYYKENLLPLLAAAPYNHRVYFKPKGYPGDFEMIRMVHANAFEGSTLFGKMMNKYSTSIPIARVVRERTAYCKDLVLDMMSRKENLKVLSVASGPALEFDLLLRENGAAASGASITLLDQEAEALEYSMEKLYESRLRAGSTVAIRFLQQSLGNYLRAVARGKVEERYDLVYASGLFDYFDDRTSAFVIGKLLRLLGGGGTLVVANLSLTGHDHRVFMEYGHEWNLVYRSLAEMEGLARAVEGCPPSQVTEIGAGMLKLLTITK